MSKERIKKIAAGGVKGVKEAFGNDYSEDAVGDLLAGLALLIATFAKLAVKDDMLPHFPAAFSKAVERMIRLSEKPTN